MTTVTQQQTYNTQRYTNQYKPSVDRPSVLDSVYTPPDRPYSRKELQRLREDLRRKIRLGPHTAEHVRCKHFYVVKQNSRKEKEILESGSTDAGNCSVCWKLKNTPREMKDKAYNLVEAADALRNEDEKLTYDLLDLETAFFTWLYLETDESDRPRREYRLRNDRYQDDRRDDRDYTKPKTD